MDTSQILFICGGTFVGLEDIIRKRLGKRQIGFTSELEKAETIDERAHTPNMAVKSPDETGASTPEWETIEQVFAALESPLLIYARRLLGNRAVAEDIVQEAFMKLHMRFKQVQAPQPWLYRAVHNLAVDHQRRAAGRADGGFGEGGQTGADPVVPRRCRTSRSRAGRGSGWCGCLETLDDQPGVDPAAI
jgi:hypothetical protein